MAEQRSHTRTESADRKQLLGNLRFLRRTAKFKFAKNQFLLVGEVMHQAADEIERLTERLSVAEEFARYYEGKYGSRAESNPLSNETRGES